MKCCNCAVVCHLAQAVMQQTAPLQHWPELGVQILKHSSGGGGEAMLEEKNSVLSKSNTKAFLDIALSHTFVIMTTLQKLATSLKCML